MSEMFATTGKTRDHICEKCGQVIRQQENRGVYAGTILWTNAQHLAPCGLYCWGAGVPAKAYREKQIHGHDAYPCPASGCQG